MEDFAAAYGDRVRAFAERLVRFETTAGDEAPAQEWVRDRLADLDFETYTWTADADALASHPSFASAGDLSTEDRPSVAGVLELGDPDAGRTLVLNGHVDVVPAGESGWTGDPFEPRWDGDRLVGRGAVDMKSQLATCVFAARHLADRVEAGEFDLDGRIVVESVAGEEDGGLGAAAAALSNPYPFERDAAVVAEPTDMRVVTATEGCLMGRIGIEGTPAHAARRWEGESVLPGFERVRQAFKDLEAERADAVTHPLYDRFDVPWPIVIGRVEAGTWASNVPGTLAAELRVGVAPGESLDSVEAACRETLDAVAAEESWSVDPPTFERFGVQFASAEIEADEPVVAALQEAMAASGLSATAPTGETYGSDARHYVAAGIPTVVFGPGRIEEAHFPDESVRWPEVLTAGAVLVETARRFLSD
ncbi:M20/M25/M40 family metallo-hydrolase [Halosimplex amylolyticum]|uniref:M20/M25/M40 family metallo-hydrolase n=1 Tax=Halosimplex amylolyticum TaxID=3396616 RepID=UPI003F568D8F